MTEDTSTVVVVVGRDLMGSFWGGRGRGMRRREICLVGDPQGRD